MLCLGFVLIVLALIVAYTIINTNNQNKGK